MKSKKIILFFTFLFTTIQSTFASYYSQKTISIGDIGQNLFSAEMNLHDFIQAVCITSGIALILVALVQFKKYRRNPIATKLSTVITNLVIGCILIILAFIPFQL